MSHSAASAILQGKLLIDPGYAHANLTFIMQLMKDQISDKGVLFTARQQKSSELICNLPQKNFSAADSKLDAWSVTPYTSIDRLPYDSIVIIDVIGPIYKYGSWYSWGTVEMTDLIFRMGTNEKVKGIILNIDSPGGQAAGTADFAAAIRTVSKLKPVLGIVQDGIAASAGMWIASAVQEMYVTQPTDMVGSIGAYNTIFDLTKYFEEMGIIYRDIYAPQSVDKNRDYRDAVEKGDDSLIEADLKVLVDHFILNVKINRSGRITMQDKEPFTGKMYYADAAVKMGLIEGIKPLPLVIKRLEQLIALAA